MKDRVIGRLMAHELTAAEVASIGGGAAGDDGRDQASTCTPDSYFPDGTLADCEMPD
jgi:hypothetical protein